MDDLTDDQYRVYDAPKTLVRFKLLHPNAKAPTQGHPGDAGWDLYLPEAVTLVSGRAQKVPLGIAVALPEGWEMQCRPRSSASARNISVAFGTVDSGYRGELMAVVRYDSITPPTPGQLANAFTLDAGMRIVQAVIKRIYPITWQQVDELDSSSRGEGGFGSTGR